MNPLCLPLSTRLKGASFSRLLHSVIVFIEAVQPHLVRGNSASWVPPRGVTGEERWKCDLLYLLSPPKTKEPFSFAPKAFHFSLLSSSSTSLCLGSLGKHKHSIFLPKCIR